MSELVAKDAEVHSELGDVSVVISPGALIREAREASGVHVDVLAAALKITVDRLEALESDRFTELPDIVFARALASSACRILRIDPVNVLALMPKNQAYALPVGRPDINATFKDSSGNHGKNSFSRQFTRPLVVAVIVLLVGAGVVFFLPERSGVPESVVTAPTKTLASTDNSENFLLGHVSPAAQQLASSPSLAKTPSIAVGGDDDKVLDVKTAESAVVAPDLMANGILEFRAREMTWVQVRDATKSIVFERTLAKGVSAYATGIPPLSVVIGRADSTDVFVRGEPFALASVAKENVARFEVK